MGLMTQVMGLLFGPGGNMIRDTAEVFRVNAEAQAGRDDAAQARALEQFTAEFLAGRQSRFDRFMDALNRVPRPAMALGTLGLFVSAMVDPVWFAERMTGIALVPEPLWWLLAAIVGFYFGARHQTKGQEFQRGIAATMANAPQVVSQIRDLGALRAGDGRSGELRSGENPPDAVRFAEDGADRFGDGNPALDEWQRGPAQAPRLAASGLPPAGVFSER